MVSVSVAIVVSIAVMVPIVVSLDCEIGPAAVVYPDTPVI